MGLVRADDCTELLGALQRRALREVSPFGFAQEGSGVLHGGVAADRAAGPTAGSSSGVAGTGATASGSSGAGAAPAYSTTNDQEAGVDEPDLAKTDGRILAMIRSGRRVPQLQLVAVDGDRPRLAGSVPLQGLQDPQLLLVGTEVVVLGTHYLPSRRSAEPATRVVVVDVRDPDHPVLQRILTVRGGLVDARLIAGRVEVVTESVPALPLVYPNGHRSRRQALARNRRIIETASIGAWLPRVHTSSGRTWPVDCPSVFRPRVDSGVGMVSVTSIDPDSDATGAQVSVAGSASVVYASTTAMYLATNGWADRVAIRTGHTLNVRTQVHGFDLSDPAQPGYLGSTDLPGTVLNQYSLSEDNGYLRVATTVGDALPPPGEGSPPQHVSDNVVTVLHPEHGTLATVGRLTGLGRGERIYAVRFLGSLGYVVTFRQTDPLFVLDLSDPTEPRQTGELHLTGFSSYLHPLDGGLLFGLGMAVDARLRQRGVQGSVFDVSDPRHPQLDGRLRFGESWSPATDDPHRFLWWAPARLVVVPLEQYDRGFRTSDVVLHVDRGGALDELGRVRQPGSRGWQEIQRALVIGDLLYTVSDRGVMASHLDTLAMQAWLPFQ